MNKIIVPTDFSEEALHALDFAIGFNRYYKGNILLLHVMDIHDSKKENVKFHDDDNVEDLFEAEEIEQVMDKMDGLLQRIAAAGFNGGFRLKAGDTFKKISKTISEERATLIVMSSHGSSGLKELLRGSHAEQVIRYADCPVPTVKGSTSPEDIKEIVFASDLTDEQHVIIEKAKTLQKVLGGIPIHVLYVRMKQELKSSSDAQRLLEGFVSTHNLTNYTLNSVEADHIHEGIMDFAKEKNAGLVAMGTHGNRGLAHLLVGSRAEELVHHSDIPVLTYKIFH